MRSLPTFPLALALSLALPFALSSSGCAGDDSASTASDTQTTNETNATGTASDSDSETGNVDVKTQLCGTGDKAEGSGANLMEKWGAPCTSNDDCVALAGEGAECLENILDIYLLPQGYCSKPCSLPNSDTQYVDNDPMCGDGMTCLGAVGFFETCALPCTSDDECQRDGFSCQLLPQIGAEGDPKFCLMNYECTLSCIDDPTQMGCS